MNKAFKKMMIGLTISATVFMGMIGIGFTDGNNYVTQKNNDSLAYQREYNDQYSKDGYNDNCYNDEAYDEEEFAPITLEEYLGVDFGKINSSQKAELQKMLDKINNFELKEDDDASYDKYMALFDEFDKKLGDMGLAVPYSGMGDFVESYKDKLSENDYKALLKLDEKMAELNEKLDKLHENEVFQKEEDLNNQINELYGEMDDILLKNNLNPEEVFTQVEGNNVILALFDVNQGKIQLSDRNTKDIKTIPAKDIELYQKLWDHAKKIIPNDYLNKITKFEINTDGYQNVMAHVVSESTDQSKWRLALDVKDAVNSDGSFNKEIDNTIVHEFMHVITLNNSQLKDKVDPYSNTYNVDEGTLTEGSYLNKFYNKFWKSLEKEFNESSDAQETDGENQFYLNHETEFVSDYAATNPVEDIAEAFRVFVLEDAPKDSKLIKDKKVLFFYSFDELVKFRTEIRANLGLGK